MTHFNPICLIYVHIDTSEHVWLVKLYFITDFMSLSLKMLRKSIMVWARSSVCIPARSKMLCCPSLKKEADMYFLSHAAQVIDELCYFNDQANSILKNY